VRAKSLLPAERTARIMTHFPDDLSTDHGIMTNPVGEVRLSLSGHVAPAGGPPIKNKASVFYWDTVAGGAT